jgi:hypothetical protein
MISLTTYTSIVIALGALCTTWSHMRRHWYRLSFCLMSILLSVPVTLLADKSIRRGQFPMEACLPFFKEYLPMMRKSFTLLTVAFWACATLMVALLLVSPFGESSDANARKRSPLERWAEKSRVYVFLAIELIFLVLVVLVNHFFVPEQVLREQARGELAEGHWSFGQIVGMLIWLPVTAEFVFIFWCKLNVSFPCFDSEDILCNLLVRSWLEGGSRRPFAEFLCRCPEALNATCKEKGSFYLYEVRLALCTSQRHELSSPNRTRTLAPARTSFSCRWRSSSVRSFT